MEANRRPIDVGNMVHIKHAGVQGIAVILLQHNVSGSADADVEVPNRKNSFPNRKENTRRRVRQAIRAQKGARETQERAKSSREAAQEHR